MQYILPRVSLKVASLAFIVMSSVVLLAPSVSNHVRAEADCAIVYSNPILNPSGYPTRENPGDCEQYPFMESQVVGKTNYSQGGVTAQPGDVIQVALYIHNGAAVNSNAIATGLNLSVNAGLN